MTEEMKNLSRVSEVLTSNWYHCIGVMSNI